MKADREARTRAAPEQLDRHQQERRPVAALVLGLLAPAQEADGEEQSVRAAFGEVVPDLTMQIDKPSFELLCVERRGELVPQQRLSGETALQVPAMDIAVQSSIALAERVLLGQGYDADGGAMRQPVLEIGDVSAEERDGLLRVREIKQPVAQRQVEQLLLPAVNAARCGRRLLLDHIRRDLAEKRGRRKRQRRGLGGIRPFFHLLRRLMRG